MRKFVAPGSPGLVVAGALLCLAGVVPQASAERLTLEDCARRALGNNLQLEQVQNNLVRAEADVTGANSQWWPRLNLRGSYTRSELPRVTETGVSDDFFQGSAEASFTIFDGFGRIGRVYSANHSRSARGEDLRKSEQDVVYETVDRYVQVLKNEILLDVQNEALDLSREQLKKSEAMRDLGAATQADVYKARVDVANNRIGVLRAERDFALSKAGLASFVGLDPTTEIELAEIDLEYDVDYTLESSLGKAMQTSPALGAARLDVNARKYDALTSKSGYWPAFTAFGAYDYFEGEFFEFGSANSVQWRYGLSLNWLLFDGFLRESNVRKANANLVTSRRTRKIQEREVKLQVQTAYLDLDIAREAIPVAIEAVESSEEDLRLATERYRIGEGTILDVIDAQVNLTRSREQHVSAVHGRLLAVAALRRAIGELPIPGTMPETNDQN